MQQHELNDATPCGLGDKSGVIGRFANNYFDGLPVRGIHQLLFFLIMAAYFFEQFDNWNFGFVAPRLARVWNLSNTDIGVILFWYFLGMTAGGFFGGIVSDIIGRRKTFLASIVIFSGASIVTGFTDNFWVFTIFRALTGLGVFSMMVTSQAYIAEMAPCESRGTWQGRVAAVGFTAVPVVALICRQVLALEYQDSWRWIFYAGGLGFIPFLIGLKYLRESPRWLVAQGRVREAEENIFFLTGKDIDLSEAAQNVPPKTSLTEVLTGMFTRRYIGRSLLLILLFITTTPATFLITTWTTKLIKDLGFSEQQTLTAMIIISIGVPVGCFISSLVSDKGGRKIPLFLLAFMAAIFAVAFGFVGQSKHLVLMITMGFLVTAGNMAMGFVLISYTAESYPTRMRNTATGFLNALARLSVSMSQRVVPLVQAGYGFMGVMFSVAFLLLLPLLPLLLWGQRTGGKSLEEIE
ncbi:MAG: MFS transporter [bacterium]|nr:MFS transporter [bacterium]